MIRNLFFAALWLSVNLLSVDSQAQLDLNRGVQIRPISSHVESTRRPVYHGGNSALQVDDATNSQLMVQETNASDLTDTSSTGADGESDSESPQSEAGSRSPTLSQWPSKSMANLRIDPRPLSGEIPSDQADRLISQYARDWVDMSCVSKGLFWDAPNIRYQPLYFEDVDLERYGHVVRDDLFQSAVSFAHFFSSAALLPFHMRHDPVYSCDYPLGYCRPGNCTNQIFQRQFWGRIK